MMFFDCRWRGEYLFGGLGPDEGFAAVVPALDEPADGGDQVLD
jgi:hypothetical protein